MSANLLSVNFFWSSESETIELKEVVVDEIKKEIIAFANCDGGKLYIGVQDDGTVVGVDDPDGVSLGMPSNRM